MEPLQNFDIDMLCTRLQTLSMAQKRHPPEKKEIKKESEKISTPKREKEEPILFLRKSENRGGKI